MFKELKNFRNNSFIKLKGQLLLIANFNYKFHNPCANTWIDLKQLKLGG